MSDQHPHSADIGQPDFDQQVLQRSHTLPVVADFWAPWCGPCKTLMPLLARLASDYQGKFFLARINTDQEQELATRHAIRSLPTVKIFRHGLVVDEFMGAQPERAIREILDRHIPRESDALVDQAEAAWTAGNREQALTILTRAMDIDPDRDRPRLRMAKLMLESGRYDEGEKLLRSLSPAGRSGPEATAQLARLEFLRSAADSRPQTELEQTLAANPRDPETRYQLAARYVVAGKYEQALDQLLEIVRHDRRFRDDAGRKAILAIFNILGGQGELVARYRKLLSLALN